MSRLKFYACFLFINSLFWLYLYIAPEPSSFIVVGTILPIPLFSAWVSWRLCTLGEIKKEKLLAVESQQQLESADTVLRQGEEMQFGVDDNNIDTSSALIYMWEIKDSDDELLGRYVGKAKGGAKRPMKHYKRNVMRFLSGKPYRKSKPDGYRQVHIALAAATKLEHKISLTFLRNVTALENINDVEQLCITQKNCRGKLNWQLNG